MMQTPPEVISLAGSLRGGSPEPPRSRLTLLQRIYRMIRPRRGCGCQARKQMLNRWIPGLGDAMEFVTRWTGVKKLVDWWTK